MIQLKIESGKSKLQTGQQWASTMPQPNAEDHILAWQSLMPQSRSSSYKCGSLDPRPPNSTSRLGSHPFATCLLWSLPLKRSVSKSWTDRDLSLLRNRELRYGQIFIPWCTVSLKYFQVCFYCRVWSHPELQSRGKLHGPFWCSEIWHLEKAPNYVGWHIYCSMMVYSWHDTT